MRRTVLIGGAAAAVALAACGGASLPAVAEPPDEAVGGDVEQVVTPGVFSVGNLELLTGAVAVDDRGCWWIEIGGVRYLAAFPEGSQRDGDGLGFTTPGGYHVEDGATVDTLAAVVHTVEVPDVPDGAWGSLVTFCEPDPSMIVVMSSVDDAYDPRDTPAEEWLEAVSTATLDVDHPCGFGFAVSTEDQRIAVVAYWSSLVEDGGDPRSTVTFPDPGWNARLLVGKNLMANNCDDVFEPWEPAQVIAGDHPLTGGVLTFVDADARPTECGGSPVVAVLSGATATTSAGEVRLPDLELENRSYGCFAG